MDIQEYCIVALDLARNRKPLAREFLAGLRARAREEWWPCLTRLQVAHYRKRGNKLYSVLVERWTEFGVALGLEEEKERKRHRREERVFCSWPDCEFNTKRPPSKLSVCQACGEAQYCGRLCQKRSVFDQQVYFPKSYPTSAQRLVSRRSQTTMRHANQRMMLRCGIRECSFVFAR